MSDEMGSKPSGHFIWELNSNSAEDIEGVWQMWQTIFPAWPISKERMQFLLTARPGHHGLHEQGFYLSFLADGEKGQIAAVGVLPEHRRQGLGTALLNDARYRLRQAAIAAGTTVLKSLEIGSSAPRFWPQLPAKLPEDMKSFLSRSCIAKSVLAMQARC